MRECKRGRAASVTVSYQSPSPSGNRYVVHRPADIGDLDRPLCVYDGKEMTQEQAHALNLIAWREARVEIDNDKLTATLAELGA